MSKDGAELYNKQQDEQDLLLHRAVTSMYTRAGLGVLLLGSRRVRRWIDEGDELILLMWMRI